MRSFYVYVDGDPVPKGRPRSTMRTKRDGTPYPHVYSPARTAAAERVIWAHFKDAYPGAEPIAEPFSLELRFFEGHANRGKWADVDNLAKLVMDALNGHAWVDDKDCQILQAIMVRRAALPHTEIMVSTLAPDEYPTDRRQPPLGAATA